MLLSREVSSSDFPFSNLPGKSLRELVTNFYKVLGEMQGGTKNE